MRDHLQCGVWCDVCDVCGVWVVYQVWIGLNRV